MSEDALGQWWKRIERARERRRPEADMWDMLVKEYTPRPTATGKAQQLNTMAHFRNVERKKAQLFFQEPDLILTPSDRMASEVVPDPSGEQIQNPETGQSEPKTVSVEDAIARHQAVLNHKLGPHGVHVTQLMDEVLLDILQVSGIGPTQISYEAFMQDVEGTPVPVFEEFAWERFSPKALLIPADFRSSQYDKAPWLAREFTKPIAHARETYDLPKDFGANAASDTHVLKHDDDIRDDSGQELISGVMIWLKTSLFDATVKHPQRIRELVLIKGLDRPARYRESPYQGVDQKGVLTADSMIGFPLHLFTIRDLMDSAWPLSDSAVTQSLVKERNTFRTQEVQIRDANIPKFAYDTNEVIPDILNKIKNGVVGSFIGFKSGVLARGIDKVIAQITTGERARADYAGQNAIDQDLENTLGLQVAAPSSSRTATEVKDDRADTSALNEKQQTRILAQFLKGVGKFDTLLQRFASADDVIEIIGQDGATTWETWNKQVIAGRFAYTARPDSQLRIDAAQDRQHKLNLYNLTANDPGVKREATLKPMLRAHGIDPTKAMQEPEEPKPEPNVTIRFTGDDLVGPAAPMVVVLLKQAGYEITPQMEQLAQQLGAEADKKLIAGQVAHGGPAEVSEPISKHGAAFTGNLPGPA